jgi:3-isopropylmalate/(R)-2-methylmalate dehydratase small subunit
MKISGRVWKYGDDVNTDVIFPGKYTYTIRDPVEMAKHALEDLDPGFAESVQTGDVVVAGRNFGCGSSREQAATCLKYAGVGAVVAVSFSRLFFRNAINQGLPAVVCPEAVSDVRQGDVMEVDLAEGSVTTPTGSFRFPAPSGQVLAILGQGGLIPFVRARLGQETDS